MLNLVEEKSVLEMLEGMKGLKESVKLYIPSRTASGKQIDPSQVLSHCAISMERDFGGATVTPGTGYWTDDNGTTHMEAVHIITSNTDEVTEELAESLLGLAYYTKMKLDQMAVTIEINGTMYFI